MIELAAVREELGRQALLLRSLPRGRRSQEEWAAEVAQWQAVVNAASAGLAAAVARTVAFEESWQEDGTCAVLEVPVGRGDEDGVSVVAGRLGCTEQAACGRVEAAAILVGDLPEVFEAMAAGTVDDYRARRVATELVEASPAARRAVSAALAARPGLLGAPADAAHPEPVMAASAPRLAEQARRTLCRIDATLLRARAERARAARGLTRGLGEPGMEHWRLDLPAELAGPLWAALDVPAQRLVREGGADTIAQARLDALLALTHGRLVGRFDVVLTVPSAGERGDSVRAVAARVASRLLAAGRSQVEVGGLAAGRTAVQAEWLAELVLAGRLGAGDDGAATRPLPPDRPDLPPAAGVRLRLAECDPVTGALGRPLTGPAVGRSESYRPSAEVVAFVRARDRRCRFPGCQVAARFCDLDHVSPWPHGPTEPANLVCLCRRHHRTKQRHRWRARLDDDGFLHWTDPTGLVRSTAPADQCDATLPAGLVPVAGPAPVEVLPTDPDLVRADRLAAAERDRASLLEDALVHHVVRAGGPVPGHVLDAVPERRRRQARRRAGGCARVDVHLARQPLRVVPDGGEWREPSLHPEPPF